MRSLSKDRLDALLGGIVCADECALVHEAALMAWGIDNNLVPYAVDVLVPKKEYARIVSIEGGVESECQGNRFVQIKTSYASVRIWKSVGEGMTYGASRLVNCVATGYKCLHPELVLEALPSSPDFSYLLEQRAALAEVLYFDDMTDEELMEFRSFVRGV